MGEANSVISHGDEIQFATEFKGGADTDVTEKQIAILTSAAEANDAIWDKMVTLPQNPK